jgi:hypothetical protein
MLMMLGSVEALLVQPKPAGNADESMSMEVDSEGNALVKMPSGLENLGNTCYVGYFQLKIEYLFIRIIIGCILDEQCVPEFSSKFINSNSNLIESILGYTGVGRRNQGLDYLRAIEGKASSATILGLDPHFVR